MPNEITRLEDSPWYTPDDRGLVLNRVPTYNEWESGLDGLSLLHHNLPKIIGDYINVGEDSFGERYSQAIEVFGEYSYQTVQNYASICRSVPYERRHPELTLAHYKAIRTLSPDEQIAWQERAVSEGWNTAELWDEVHGNGRSFFSDYDKMLEALAVLQGQCQSSEAVENISEAFGKLRMALALEAEERDVYNA